MPSSAEATVERRKDKARQSEKKRFIGFLRVGFEERLHVLGEP
jgi:hypothetical protein